MSVAGCDAVVRMAAFGGACAGDTARAIIGDTAEAITEATAEATMAATATTLVVRVGAYKMGSASRIAATETPLEAASVGGLFILERDVRFSNRPVWVKRFQTTHWSVSSIVTRATSFHRAVELS